MADESKKSRIDSNAIDRMARAFFDQTKFESVTSRGHDPQNTDSIPAGKLKARTGNEGLANNESQSPVYVSLNRPGRAGTNQSRPGDIQPGNPGSGTNTEDDASEFDVGLTATHTVKTRQGEVRAEGNCLVCACPECRAPMTVRAWLNLADCWRCDTSIALSEEQIAALQNNAPTPALEVATEKEVHRPRPARPQPQRQPVPVPAMAGAALPGTAPDHQHQELHRLTEGSVLARFVRRGFQLTPAWVASFVLHLVLILILAVIVFGGSLDDLPTISLSASLSSDREPGGQIRIENRLDLLQDDIPLASDLPEDDQEIRDVIEQAQKSAAELLVDPQPTAPQMDVDVLRRNVTTSPNRMMSFVARDPRVRSEIVRREGGTLMTEAAVARGLRWLASVQNQDGSWSLSEFDRHDRPKNRGDAMATALALLPFLGAGQTHEFGIYKQTVSSGLAWLIQNQKDDGDLRAGYNGNAGMYAHGQASIVLCEALAMTGDEQFREPAQMAIRFIEQGQHRQGGWRYQPGEVGDTSVLGWQLMALQSARSPDVGLEVDPATLKLADYFLDSVIVTRNRRSRAGRDANVPNGSLYAYMPDRNATPAMTAEALLCRMYLGWEKDDPRVEAGVRWLAENHPPERSDMNIYYWYYGSQLLHNYGGREWKAWNKNVKQLLLISQKKRGRHPGSWDPGDFEWGDQGGRIYTTAMSVCTLEVYYRHLPLFRTIELG